MSKDSFEYLCLNYHPISRNRTTNFHKAIAVCHRVAITLYWLADSACYRTIGNLFGVGKSTVCTIVKQVCEVLAGILLPWYCTSPKFGRLCESKRIPRIFVGWPAKVHDTCVFKNSLMFCHCCARTFLPLQLSRVITSVRVPPSIVGDSAHALSDWLMKPYTDNGNLMREQVNFNKILSMTRVVVENAYGRLKGRFRSIAKRLDLNVENVCLVIAACCVLHNFCEVMGEDFSEEFFLVTH